VVWGADARYYTTISIRLADAKGPSTSSGPSEYCKISKCRLPSGKDGLSRELPTT
jgi:hypothetical protein